jgi:hypothetical protein
MFHPPVRRPGRSDSDVPVLGLLVILLLLVLAGGGGFMLFQYRQTQMMRAEAMMMEMRAREAEEEARAEADKALAEARRHERALEDIRRENQRPSAAPLLERGLKLCGDGQVNEGLLWFARGLEQSGDDPAMQRVFRANLAAWGQPQVGRQLFAQKSAVTALAVSPDGKAAVAGGEDGAARAWTTDGGQPLGEAAAVVGKVSAVGFGDGGKQWLVANGGEARRIDATTGKPDGNPLEAPGPVLALTGKGDGKLLMAGICGQGVWQCDEGGREGAAKLTTPESPVLSLALAADANVILTGHEDQTAHAWSAEGKPLGTLPRQGAGVRAVAVSADGKLFATAAGKAARVWDAATRLPIGRPWTGEAEVLALAFSPDGKTLLAGDQAGLVRQCPVAAPLTADPLRIKLWVQVMARQELDAAGTPHQLNDTTLQERRRKLQELGGPLTP